MPLQTRLELDGKPVKNRFLRTALSVIILFLVATLLLTLGVLLLPIFIAVVAVIAIAGAIFFYRIRKRVAALKEEGRFPSNLNQTTLDPSMEVRVDRRTNTAPDTDASSRQSIE